MSPGQTGACPRDKLGLSRGQAPVSFLFCTEEAQFVPGTNPPRGPKDQKNSISLEIFNLDRNFQSRSRFSISTSRFPPQKIGPRWVARSKIFNLARNLQSRSKSRIFFDLWALWAVCPWDIPGTKGGRQSLCVKSLYVPFSFPNELTV